MGEKGLSTAYFHLPGLFEFYELYKVFLPLFKEHREYFYGWCEIGSIYGAPKDCIWGGGREGIGDIEPQKVLALLDDYGISARLTFSNSLLGKEHLDDYKCNKLCEMFEQGPGTPNGVIVHSELLLNYLRSKFPGLYYISSTTKTLLDFSEFEKEIERDAFKYVVPDFRLNRRFDELDSLSQDKKDKVEFLCNECCAFGCRDRRRCYEEVSRKILGIPETGFCCSYSSQNEGYLFSAAMSNPGFISITDITEQYFPMGFSNFKIEGRGLGSALVLEFLLYYLTKPEYQIHVREKIYLNNMLDLF